MSSGVFESRPIPGCFIWLKRLQTSPLILARFLFHKDISSDGVTNLTGPLALYASMSTLLRFLLLFPVPVRT